MDSRNTSPRSGPGLLAFILPALVALLAYPAPALALGDYAGVEGTPWVQGFDGKAAIDNGSTAGTTFDFRSDLGLDNRDTSQMGRVWFRMGKSHLLFDYADSSRTGSNSFTQNITYNGTTYSSGESVDSSLGLTLLQGQYRYSFVNLKVAEFGAGIGLNLAKVDMQMDGTVSGVTNFNKTIPFPTANATFILKPFPGFHIRAELQGLGVGFSGNSVTIYDARLQLEWYFLHAFGVVTGYRQYHFDADSNDFGHVQSNFKGPFIGLGVKF
ncbi:MAG TPA: hypothetical protein VFT43_07830 [Candidatus Polarisedimenticolia bacterium]|nr:hypothetical protein [Candidatus Polarisedimenticolia bacterium]